MNIVMYGVITLLICTCIYALWVSSYNAGQQNVIRALRNNTEVAKDGVKYSCYLKAINYKRFATQQDN